MNPAKPNTKNDLIIKITEQKIINPAGTGAFAPATNNRRAENKSKMPKYFISNLFILAT